MNKTARIAYLKKRIRHLEAQLYGAQRELQDLEKELDTGGRNE